MLASGYGACYLSWLSCSCLRLRPISILEYPRDQIGTHAEQTEASDKISDGCASCMLCVTYSNGNRYWRQWTDGGFFLKVICHLSWRDYWIALFWEERWRRRQLLVRHGHFLWHHLSPGPLDWLNKWHWWSFTLCIPTWYYFQTDTSAVKSQKTCEYNSWKTYVRL